MEPMTDAEKVAAMRDAATDAWRALNQLDDRYHNGDYRWALNAVGRLANTLNAIASADEPPAQMTLDDWLLELDTKRKPLNKTLRVTSLRVMRGWSQSELARRAIVNESSMSRIERGLEPAFPKRGKRIADALGFAGDPSYLFEECDIKQCNFVKQYGWCDKCQHIKGEYPYSNTSD